MNRPRRPVVLLGPFGGVLADRIDRRIIVFGCHILVLIEASALCALAALGLITIEWLFALTLFRGSVVGIHQPARLALVPALVRKQDVAAAFAINSVTFNLARFVGPAIAGVVITQYGLPHAFAFPICQWFGDKTPPIVPITINTCYPPNWSGVSS